MDEAKNVVNSTDGATDDAANATGDAVNELAEDTNVDSDDLGTTIDDELPQRFTESYETGVREIPG
jgi:hypothetical protein